MLPQLSRRYVQDRPTAKGAGFAERHQGWPLPGFDGSSSHFAQTYCSSHVDL
jgi:hypothetical protein